MRATLVLSLAATVAACASAAGDAPEGGTFSATWDGRDRGSGRLVASALYCPRDSTLEILAHSGDRGVGVALHLDSAAPGVGTFSLVHPETEFVPRPGATGAYRFLTIEALHPYVSRNGQVELTEVGPDWVSGTIEMTLTAQSGPDTVVVRGTFARVPMDSTRTPCGIAPRQPMEIP